MRALVAAAFLALASTAAAPTADRPTPADLPSAETAIANGIEQLCPWFLAGQGYSLPNAQERAFELGFRRGNSVQYMPVGMSESGGTSALGFSAQIADAPAQGSGVPAFLGFDPANCQLQVWGYQSAMNDYFVKMPSLGWQKIEERAAPSGNITSTVFGRTIEGRSLRLTYNRWTLSTPPENGLWGIINVMPGG